MSPQNNRRSGYFSGEITSKMLRFMLLLLSDAFGPRSFLHYWIPCMSREENAILISPFS